jgi:hypothetical protein
MIFPLFILMFFPPLLFILLFGNLIIDGLVIWLTLVANKIKIDKYRLFGKILKAWGVGFIIDIFGALLLFGITYYIKDLPYFSWGYPENVFWYLLVIVLCGFLIFLFNFMLFKKEVLDKKIRIRVGLFMGLITAPWTFLISSELFR